MIIIFIFFINHQQMITLFSAYAELFVLNLNEKSPNAQLIQTMKIGSKCLSLDKTASYNPVEVSNQKPAFSQIPAWCAALSLFGENSLVC